MRIFIILALVLFLVGCGVQQGKGMFGALSNSSREQSSAITGQVIGDIYNDKVCLDDSDCGPSQHCVSQRCVVS